MSVNKSLDKLRDKIDSIDQSLHDLIMQRANVVAEIKEAKQDTGGPIFWPAREAEVLRKLMGRHRGELPLGVITRIWRELISASLIMQGDFEIAVTGNDDGAYWDIVRDHFGSQTPIIQYETSRGVLRAVAEATATVGVLPLPQIDESEPWWPLLGSQGSESSLRICARLPFESSGNRRGHGVEALLVAEISPVKSDDDISYVIIEIVEPVSRSRITSTLTAEGLKPSSLVPLLNNKSANEVFLIEVGGFVEVDDPRLKNIVEKEIGLTVAQSVGSYAVPLNSGK